MQAQLGLARKIGKDHRNNVTGMPRSITGHDHTGAIKALGLPRGLERDGHFRPGGNSFGSAKLDSIFAKSNGGRRQVKAGGTGFKRNRLKDIRTVNFTRAHGVIVAQPPKTSIYMANLKDHEQIAAGRQSSICFTVTVSIPKLCRMSTTQSRCLGTRKLPATAAFALRRNLIEITRNLLAVSIRSQHLSLFEWRAGNGTAPRYEFVRQYLISTSAFGVGQVQDSNRTPLGLHRVAQKIGAGQPIGTVFKSRQVLGLTWKGQPDATIVHRILWLEGLEPGFNRGGNVDSFRRYIYIHGFGDETTLGRPKSHGCIHMAANDLIPLFDRLEVGTLVWIGE